MEIENYISLFSPPDLLLRVSSSNSPGYVGSQTATVNKQDYPFEHASKSYHIGAEKGGGGQNHSKMVDGAEARAGTVAKKILISLFAFFLIVLWLKVAQMADRLRLEHSLYQMLFC